MRMSWMDCRLHNTTEVSRYHFAVESHQVHTFLRCRRSFAFCVDVTFACVEKSDSLVWSENARFHIYEKQTGNTSRTPRNRSRLTVR